MSSSKTKLKSSFKLSKSYSPIHTGGKISLSNNSIWLFSTLNDQINSIQLKDGKKVLLGPLSSDTSPITTHSITPFPSSPLTGGYLLTCSQSLTTSIYSLPSFTLIKSIPKSHEAPIITSCSDPTGRLFATGSADGIVKVWDGGRGVCTHVFKGHGGVISALRFYISTPSSTGEEQIAKLISGADDCKIRVWDLITRECLHILEGHNSVIRGLDVSSNGKILISGGRDKILNLWDLERGVIRRTIPVFETLETCGFAEVPSSSFNNNNNTGKKGKGKGGEQGEEGEEKKLIIYTGGDKGLIRLWDLSTGELIDTGNGNGSSSGGSGGEGGKTHEILDIIYSPLTSTLTALYVDQNIIIKSLPNLNTIQQIIGFNDEVIDTLFLSSPSSSSSSSSLTTNLTASEGSLNQDTHLAIATNSDLIRIYNLNKFNTTLLEGHKDVVLCLAKSTDGRVLVSGSKDKTGRVWLCSASSSASSTSNSTSTILGVDSITTTPEQQEPEWNCIGQATGHIESIGAIAISKKDNSFLITASQDLTAKVWDLNSLLSSTTSSSSSSNSKEPPALKSLTTLKIHTKEINALDISPNDKLLASASQDRTAKLYSISHTPASGSRGASASLVLLGTFKGHKRGVWSVRFSGNDMCLATGSGDRTVKLWSLGDFSCLKTFEGHSNSVLRVDFLSRGMQLISTASDGLVKLWNVKDEECVTTLDGHDEKIWALAISQDEKTIVSAGADSVINFWEDITEEEELERISRHEENILKEQDFKNFVSIKDYSNAILLALSLDQPKRLLHLFQTIHQSHSLFPNSITGSTDVDLVIKSLVGKDLKKLLEFIVDWNSIGRTSELAQRILNAIFKFHSSETILKTLELIRKSIPTSLTQGQEDIESDEEDSNLKSIRIKKLKEFNSGKKELKVNEILGALIPYTERHFVRADKMVRESFIVDHLLGMMDDGIMEMEVEE